MADIEKQIEGSGLRKSSIDVGNYEDLNRHSAIQPPDVPLLSLSPEGMDGGGQAWLTVFGAFMALVCTFGQMNAFGTYQSWYSDHQLSHMSPFSISWIGSLQLWTFFFMGGPIGRVFDAFGPRPIMISGSFLLILSIVTTSICTRYYQYLLSQGFLFGLSVGMLFYPSMASVSTHFNKYRATALGIAAAGSSVGGVVYPILLQHMFRATGFSWGVRIAALVSAVCCALAVLTVQTRLPCSRKCGPWINTKVFTDMQFVLLVIGSFFVALGLFTPFFYIEEYTQDLSISPEIAFYVLSVMNAGGVFGRIAPAYLSDVIGRFNLLTPTAFLSGLSCLVFWMFSESLAAVMGFAAVYGFFSGAFISVITPCVAQISDIREIGTRIGVLYTLISLPSLFGGPIAGIMLQNEQHSYTGMIALAGASIIIGSLFILGSKLAIDRRIFARI
ncbi:MFS general substrate transporter [Hygrophoropsis aurantiaca]|uniref:MFS general substrate transporter n=1 Tax=Hygrophoropsis aurantiaca TaxID=72124 RepID=A0ACB8AJG8_9AGAM|nr:MFS general substrate transporter [Hygrophoropsis aurantiaca]